jgi:hypothetical protein
MTTMEGPHPLRIRPTTSIVAHVATCTGSLQGPMLDVSGVILEFF